jgi:hypothetical protein
MTMDSNQIEYETIEGVVVKGRVTALQDWHIEIEILEPYVGWTNHLSSHGPSRQNPSTFLSRSEELSFRLLKQLYRTIKDIDESLLESVDRYRLLLEEKEALKYIEDDEIRKSIDYKISSALYPCGISVYEREKYLTMLEYFMKTGIKTYMPITDTNLIKTERK